MTRENFIVAFLIVFGLVVSVVFGLASTIEKVPLEREFIKRPSPEITKALADIRERYDRLLGRSRMVNHKEVGDAFRRAEELWEEWAPAEALMLAYGDGNNGGEDLFADFQVHYLVLIKERDAFIRDTLGD
jgi:hypothetical protein